jgi:hypothetical protein
MTEEKTGIEAAQDEAASEAKEELFNFSEILYILKEGKKATRRGWNGKDQFIQAQFPDINSKMSLPYVYISTVSGDLVPWLCSQGDLFAEDWMIVQ